MTKPTRDLPVWRLRPFRKHLSTSGAQLVVTIIAERADVNGFVDRRFSGHASIAKEAGKSVASIKRAIREARAMGVLAVNSVTTPEKARLKNEYLLVAGWDAARIQRELVARFQVARDVAAVQAAEMVRLQASFVEAPLPGVAYDPTPRVTDDPTPGVAHELNKEETDIEKPSLEAEGKEAEVFQVITNLSDHCQRKPEILESQLARVGKVFGNRLALVVQFLASRDDRDPARRHATETREVLVALEKYGPRGLTLERLTSVWESMPREARGESRSPDFGLS
ncbi:MAG: hypothetical protein RLY93_19835 [Sumerlaeia bacterium]